MIKQRLTVIVGLVILLTALHYFTSMNIPALHIVYRELYFVPIILAGLWGGKNGGIFTSVAMSSDLHPPHVLLGAPHPVFDPNTMLNVLTSSAESRWGNFSELPFYNLAGFLSGIFTDLRRGYVKKLHPYQATTYNIQEEFSSLRGRFPGEPLCRKIFCKHLRRGIGL